MKFRSFSLWFVILSSVIFTSCQHKEPGYLSVRPLIDTVGFAQYRWQMDSIMERIDRLQHDCLMSSVEGKSQNKICKVAISPHDDYTYVGYLYPAVMRNIKARTVFLFGVAHKARLLNLENKIIFDSFAYWKGPYGKVKVSDVRNEIIGDLPADIFQMNDSIQKTEHSLEALIPFLQHHNHNVEIVPILVPYMSFERMKQIAGPLAKAIDRVVVKKGWNWGTDYAFVISTDAVHYGDEDWGDKNFAWFGTDSLGYRKAVEHEHEIIATLSGVLESDKIKSFTELTVQDTNFREYKWTWCGRYSVPLGLLAACYLNDLQKGKHLEGLPIGYSTSIDHIQIPVEDLRMGATAPANMRHWVGYAALIYY